MKLFVFAIGGTGARVLRSLTMLLAAGAKVPDNLTIIPILLDMDMQNGDTARALNGVELYRTIRNAAYPNGAAPAGQSDAPRPFFATPIQSLGTLQSETTQERIGDSFLPQLTEHQGTFEEFLNVSTMDDIDRELLKVLYDNSAKPTSAELKLDLSVGFKGNPNIGSVVFNALEDSALYKYFVGAFNNETDRIFIISSIFGGTGSSGFPQLVKLLQEPSQKMPIRNARKGAVTVMPYFALEENGQSAIDQNRFNSKTKAALSYYQNQIHLDSLYYIGDKPGAKLYANVEGGSKQANNAHIVELLAAETVLDFANRGAGEFAGAKTYYEYGLRRDDRQLDFVHFADSTFRNVMQPLIRFSYASKFYTEYIPANLRESFAKSLGLQQQLGSSTYFVALTKFMGEAFRKWLAEMGDNDRKFDPFNFQTDFNGLVRAKQIEPKTFMGFGDKGISESFLLNEAGDAEPKLLAQYPQPETRLMQMLMVVADKCMEKLGDLNRQLV
jgi:hypothetical protein